MPNRALTFGFGGYADLDVTFGEFFHSDHTVMIRFMPQYPYAGAGPMLAEASGSGSYVIGQGDYRDGSGGAKQLGPSTLLVQIGNSSAIYEVTGFVNELGGPVGYRGVWQHLAVVRQGDAIRVYLNAQELQPFDAPALTVPTSGLPTDGTAVRLGRRSAGTGDAHRFWQFYGLITEVAIYTKALNQPQIDVASAAATLTGSESGLLAGWTFDTGSLPAALSRPVQIPTQADIPEHVNVHAAHPVPAYLVGVTPDRISSEDRKQMDQRPSKVLATLPFCAGEWWAVGGWENPGGTHNGKAAFCYDLSRINGETHLARIVAAAPGRVIYADEFNLNGEDNAISVYHASRERAVYMHIAKGSFSKYFPDVDGLPQDLPTNKQPTYDALDRICDVGDFITGGDHNQDHLHFAVSALWGETWGPGGANAGYSTPIQLSDYYVSSDDGTTWTKVDRGVPKAGDWVARYPWSPWGARGSALEVAPAAASWGPNRLDVFARGENDHLWHKRWSDDKKWSEWRDLGGGRLTSSPAAVSWGPNRIDVFVRGADHQLAHKRWTDDKDWSEWRDLGGVLTSAPAVASWGPNRLDVFARGENDHLWHKRWSDGKDWSEWRDLGGGQLTSSPAAVSWGPNRIDVFVRGADHQLAHKRWTDDKDWSEWRDLGGVLTSAPAVASWGPNRLDVFARGENDHLWHKRWSDGKDWSEWRDLGGGQLTSSPAAVSWGPNRIDVFVRGADHQLAHKRWTDDKDWSEWRDLDQS